MAPARIGLSGESPARAGTPKAQIPPGNAQAQERQTATRRCRGASGERWIGQPIHPPKGSGAPAPDLSGHRTEGRQASPGLRALASSAALFDWLGDATVARHTPLFTLHQELGARMVDFGGWDMPV